jgi:hypothetical protein
MKDFTKAYNITTAATFNLQPALTVAGKYLLVMELKK